jgi:hypothetical protein
MEFDYEGGGWARAAIVALFVDGKKVGEGKVPATAPMVFSADDGCDVGQDTGSPVSEEYGPRGNEFSGRIKGVEIAIAEAAESADHLISAEDVVRVAMALAIRRDRRVGAAETISAAQRGAPTRRRLFTTGTSLTEERVHELSVASDPRLQVWATASIGGPRLLWRPSARRSSNHWIDGDR